MAFILVLAMSITNIPGTLLTSYAAVLEGFDVSISWTGQLEEDYEWITDTAENRLIRLRVAYSNQETMTSYPPGSLTFTVPGIGDILRNYLKEADDVAANKNGIGSSFDWNYTYDPDTDTYTFTNAKEIEPNTRFSGSFELVWDLPARDCVNGYSKELQAQFSMGGQSVTTNSLNFHFESEEDQYTVSQTPQALVGPDGLGDNANDYIWVKYDVRSNREEHARGTKNNYYEVTLPEGAVFQNVKEGTYEYLGDNTYRFSYSESQEIIIGYPKDTYEDQTMDNEIRLYGTYMDEEEETLLDSTQKGISFNDYGFRYTPGDGAYIHKDYSGDNVWQKKKLYEDQKVAKYKLSGSAKNYYVYDTSPASILSLDALNFSEVEIGGTEFKKAAEIARKNYQDYMMGHVETASNAIMRLRMLSAFSETDSNAYNMMAMNASGSNTIDAYVGDDFLDITTEVSEGVNNYIRLRDDQYTFKTVTIPSVYNLTNANGYNIESGKYEVDVITGRDIHADPFTTVTLDTTQHRIRLPENTNAVWLHFKDLEESLYFSEIVIEVAFHLDPEDTISLNGRIRNLSGISIFHDGDNIGDPDADSYLGSDGQRLAEQDMDTYGYYLLRHFAEFEYENSRVSHAVVPELGNSDTTDHGWTINGEKYENTLKLESDFMDGDEISEYSTYAFLPPGLELDEDRLEELLEFTTNMTHTDGTPVTPEELMEHCSISVIKDYKGSGKTLIKLDYNFEENPLNVDLSSYKKIEVTLPVMVTKDSIEEYGTDYQVYAEQMIHDYGVESYAISGRSDNGYDAGGSFPGDVPDVNDDGETDERLVYNSTNSTILKAVETHLELQKAVETKYTDGYVTVNEDGSPIYTGIGTEYSYRLKFTNDADPIKDPVIYDHLEAAEPETGARSEWLGTLVSVDVTRIEKKGYPVTVYYGTSSEHHEITDDSFWVTSPPADLSSVRSIAIEIKGTVLGGEYLSAIVTMRAPDGTENINKTALNNYHVTYTNAEGVHQELYSNTTEVTAANELGTLTIEKVDKETGQKLKDAEFELQTADGSPYLSGLKTNFLGVITISALPTGHYKLVETNPPTGYEAVTYELDIKPGENQIRVEDPRLTGTVVLTKMDAKDDTAIEGAVFDLYNSDDEVIEEGLKTDSSGKITVSDLAWDSYYFLETQAPMGYQLSEVKTHFTINKDSVAKTVYVTAIDRQKTASVTLKKTEELPDGTINKTPVSGAVYDLYIKNGDDSYEVLRSGLRTDSSGEITVTDLGFGEYYFKEKKSPSGYYLNEDTVPFTIDATTDGKEVHVTHSDERIPGSVTIVKSDDIGNRIKDAEFALYRDDGSDDGILVQSKLKTGADGFLRVDNLDWAKYFFIETRAPQGYVRSTERYYFTVNKTNAGSQILLQLENKRMNGSVLLIKTVKDQEGLRLPNAVYNLYDKNGTLVRSDITTGPDGSILVEDLPWNSYYFQEKKAPEGYSISDEKLRFTITRDNCSTVQEIVAEDKADTASITITKRITIDDIYDPFGNPTFVFKITGMDVNGVSHTWYREITLSKDLLENSVTISDVPIGTYTVTEMVSGRYENYSIKAGTSNVTPHADNATVDLNISKTGEVIFENRKDHDEKFSHMISLTNILKSARKLTGIVAQYTGPDPITEDLLTEESKEYKIPDSDLTVLAVYDDGTERALSPGEYTVSPDTLNGRYNGESHIIEVTYEEDGVTKKDTFTVGIDLPEVAYVTDVTVEYTGPEPIEDHEVTPEDFKVQVHYSDGSVRDLEPEEYEEKFHIESENFSDGQNQKGNIVVEFEEDGVKKQVTVEVETNIWAEFIYGDAFNTAIKSIANYSTISDREYADWSIQRIRMAKTVPDGRDSVVVSTPESPCEIRAYYVNSENTLYFATKVNSPIVGNSSDDNFMFYNLAGLKDIYGLENWDTSKTTNFSRMFYKDQYLTDVTALSTWDMSSAEDLSYMFADTGIESTKPFENWTIHPKDIHVMFHNCHSLKDLSGLKNWDMSGCTTLYYTFRDCPNITDLSPLAEWDVSSVKNMESTFSKCNSLTDLGPLKDWNTESVTNMTQLFYMDNSGEYPILGITDLTPLADWNVQKVTTMDDMFAYNQSLSSLNGLQKWKTNSLISLVETFYDCSSLSDITALADWNTSNVKDMRYTFYGCLNLETLRGLEKWDVQNVTTMNRMFRNSGVKDISALKDWKTPSLTDMGGMFHTNNDPEVGITSLDPLLNWDVHNVTTMEDTFYYNPIQNVDGLKNWKTNNLKDLSNTFEHCEKLEDISGLAEWDVSNVTTLKSTFQETQLLSLEPLKKWDVRKVTSLENTFSHIYQTVGGSPVGAESLSGLEDWQTTSLQSMHRTFDINRTLVDISALEKWDVSHVTDMGAAFEGLYHVTEITALKNWNTQSLVDVHSLFAECNETRIIDLSGWNTDKVKDMSKMFWKCVSLNSITYGPGFVNTANPDTTEMFTDVNSSCWPSWYSE